MRNASLSVGAINERCIRGNSLAKHSSPASLPPMLPSKKALSPPVIENLPPGLQLTPPQLLSLHSQLLASGAFEPEHLARKTVEYRDHRGRHVVKFSGSRWSIDLLRTPDAQSGSCTPSSTSSPSSLHRPFISVSLWCIAASDLDLDLSLYMPPPSTWLTRTLNLLVSPFLSSPPTPPRQPRERVCAYLFDVPKIATLPTQPDLPWRRLPRLPRRTPPPSLSALSHPHGQGLLLALGVVDVRARASRGRARGVRREGRGGVRRSVGGSQDRGGRGGGKEGVVEAWEGDII